MIPADRSQRQETKILENLAFIEGKGELSIAALAAAYARLLPKGSSVILLTPTTADDILLVSEDLQQRKLRPVVLLLIAETFGGASDTGRIAQRLQEQRIPFRSIRCDADLADSLSGFLVGNSSQDVATWQRPTLSHLT